MSGRVAERLQAGARQKPRRAWWLALGLFSRRWWWKTVLVLVGMVVCIRLAVWQHDRLEQRQSRNAAMQASLAAQPVDLNGGALPIAGASTMRYRKAIARGRYDFSRQVTLEPQNWGGVTGLHLLTPLILDGSQQAVLVDRGWIPFEERATKDWDQFEEPGLVTISGTLQTPQRLPAGSVTGPQERWYRVDLAAIQAQMPYDLLPLYLVQSPGAQRNLALPYRQDPHVDLSDGAHLYYMIQWLLFAVILGSGYVWLVSSQESKARP